MCRLVTDACFFFFFLAAALFWRYMGTYFTKKHVDKGPRVSSFCMFSFEKRVRNMEIMES